MDLISRSPQISRYSARPLPPYRHLPFRNAHPFLDEDGHSFGEQLVPPDAFDPHHWRNSPEYLYAIDLFNHRFWWEAHERLKPLSIAAGRESATGLFLQGLIQIAAALLKHDLDEPQAAAGLSEMGFGNLSAGEGVFLGIDVEELRLMVADFLQHRADTAPVICLAGVGRQ